MYPRFREPLRHHQAQAVGPMDQQLETHGDFDSGGTIHTYQQLITELPTLNRTLLLYILDMLAVFQAKSQTNKMTAANLAAIFQPGILRHPDHDMAPHEYRLSQDVVIFLIEHQDEFLIGMSGTAADEKTIQEVQTAPKPPSGPTTPKSRAQQLLGRSASNASAGSDGLRRYGDIRRNASTNSRGSRQSQHTPSPVTPPSGSPFVPGSRNSGGVFRSNTVPSKKSPSPALSASERFTRFQPTEPVPAVPAAVAAATPETATVSSSNTPTVPSSTERLGVHARPEANNKPALSPHRSPLLRPWMASARSISQDRQSSLGDTAEGTGVSRNASPAGTPTRERGLSQFWKQSPSSDNERRDGRSRNKLQKKRPQDLHPQSSQPSIGGGGGSSQPSSPALVSNAQPEQADPTNEPPPELPSRPTMSTVNSFHTAKEQPMAANASSPPPMERDSSSTTLKPQAMTYRDPPEPHRGVPIPSDGRHSPVGSMTSHSTGASQSTGDDGEGLEVRSKEKKHHRFRISMSKKADEKQNGSEVGQSGSGLGSSAGADRSTSTVGSSGRMPRQSMTEESSQSTSARAPSSSEADDRATSPRRGPIGWFRGKMQERQERKEEKERAKSPPPREHQSARGAVSQQSLSAIASSEARGGSQSSQSYQQPPPPQQPPPIVQEPVRESLVEAASAVAPTSILSTQEGLPTQPPVQEPPTHIQTEGLAPVAEHFDSSEAVTPKAVEQPLSTMTSTEPAAAAPSEATNELRAHRDNNDGRP